MLCHNRQHIWPGTIWFSKVLCLNIEAKPSPHHQPATPYNLLPDAVFPPPHQLIFTQTPFFVELPYFHSAFEFCWTYFHSDNEQWKSEVPLTRPNLIPQEKQKKRATSLNTNLHLICVPISPKAAEAAGRWTTAHSWKKLLNLCSIFLFCID